TEEAVGHHRGKLQGSVLTRPCIVDQTKQLKKKFLRKTRLRVHQLASVNPYFLKNPLKGHADRRSKHNKDLLSDQLDVELIDRENEVMLKMHHELDDIDEGLGGEVGIGLCSRRGHEYFGDSLLTRVQFRHAPRAPLSIYEDFFKAPVEFETDYNGLVVSQEILKRTNRKAGTESIAVLMQRLDELRRDMGVVDEDGLADVREAIMHNAKSGDYTVAGLASAMAMSQRSLQRRIQQTGTSTRVLIEDTRYTYAMELLADTSISIETVGLQLGFDSERGFRRAFERWTGKSPAQVRKDR
ncbi:helix-turn-helix domain-containing protein, partial [Pseudomonadota bacterium]